MSSFPEGDGSSSPLPPKPASPSSEILPPVQPPTASFLLQLFFIPMIIVMIIVALWVTASWLTQRGTDPTRLVADLRKMDDASWQRAYTLSNLLRNPEYDYLKDDEALAAELAELLDGLVREADSSSNRVQLRMFLCRALGEFRRPLIVPALAAAAGAERSSKDLAVRRAAIEALAVVGGAVDPQQWPAREKTLQAVLDASRERSEGVDREERNNLRSAAAFTLGVMGYPEALDRLELMLDDQYPNARYNAATGLARQGDQRGLEILQEMLDPDNEMAVASEDTPRGRQRKRLEVIDAGLRGVQRLLRDYKLANLAGLDQSLQQLSQSTSMPPEVQLAAKELLLDHQ